MGVTKKRAASKQNAKKPITSVSKMQVDRVDSKTVKIGIFMTYPRLEVKKEELISLRCKHRPWNKQADPAFVVERKYRRDKKIKGRHPLGKHAIPTDYAVGLYLQEKYADKNVVVDMIMPHEVSPERLKSNDLNFMMIYDPLEAFHTDKTKDKRVYKMLKKCLAECDNVFPPREYQDLIYSKIKYYNFLKKENIAIAPTLTMTSEEYAELGAEAGRKKIVEHALAEGWERFICKPVLGMEGIDATFFRPGEKVRLNKYLERCMKKYPGIVIQKEIEGFGDSKKCPELRMYYVGGKYQYSVSANENYVIRPKQEGGTFDTPLDALKKRSKKVFKKLPEITMPNGKKLPKLLTRIDMGYIVEGKYSPFVNEVEFVPSLYSEDCAHHPDRLIDVELAHQMVRITKKYKA